MAGRIIYSRFTRNLEKIAKPQELLDSHLIPQNVGYCKHRRTVVFSATNTLTPGISNYIFDADKMEVWQIHCCEAKDRKALDQEVLTVANGAEFPVFLKLDEERHLVKQYFDGEAHEFKYLPGEKVVRRFKYEENRRGERILKLHLNSLENIFRVSKTRPHRLVQELSVYRQLSEATSSRAVQFGRSGTG